MTVSSPVPETPPRTVYFTQRYLDSLLEYSSSLPSGTTVGKRWKRRVADGWYLGEYFKDETTPPDSVSVRWSKIELRESTVAPPAVSPSATSDNPTADPLAKGELRATDLHVARGGVSAEHGAIPTREPVSPSALTQFHRSASCEGETCTLCGKPAAMKVGEEIMHDDPLPNRHNYTAYVCLECGNRILCPSLFRAVSPSDPGEMTSNVGWPTDHLLAERVSPSEAPAPTPNESRVKAIQERLAKATPGEWYVDGSSADDILVRYGVPNDEDDAEDDPNLGQVVANFVDPSFDIAAANADLTANAPADLAYLLSQLSVAVAEGERLREALRSAIGEILSKRGGCWVHDEYDADCWMCRGDGQRDMSAADAAKERAATVERNQRADRVIRQWLAWEDAPPMGTLDRNAIDGVLASLASENEACVVLNQLDEMAAAVRLPDSGTEEK